MKTFRIFTAAIRGLEPRLLGSGPFVTGEVVDICGDRTGVHVTGVTNADLRLWCDAATTGDVYELRRFAVVCTNDGTPHPAAI